MTTNEKRAYIKKTAEPSLIHWSSPHSLMLLENIDTGSNAYIDDVFDRFFREGWEREQKVAIDKSDSKGV